ncbi:MAG TPA: PA2779 family protein [Aquabacterium sp.]|nr:PA2779 family protein [Aquabacterium sp.]
MTRFKRNVSAAVVSSLLFTSGWTTAQAAVISTQEVAAAQATAATLPDAATARAQIEATLARADLQAALHERGVDIAQVRTRVAAMTDQEAQQLAAQIDQAPAGAADILGTLVFIFVLLLVTDILGLTKVFPFTRSIRR